MLEFLATLVGGLVSDGLFERSRRRKLVRDLAAARALEFPGSVLGDAPYCHPAGGMLRVDGTSLTWLTGKGGMSFAVPVERLAVQALQDVRMAEAFPGGKNVAVVCDDAGITVRIVVFGSDLPYLARAIPGLRECMAAAARP